MILVMASSPSMARQFHHITFTRSSDILGTSARAIGRKVGRSLRTKSLPSFILGKENTMATYVTLFNFTEKGAREIKDTLKRVEAAKAAAKQFGVTIKEVLWLQGQYDLVAITEVTDEIAAAALTLNTIKLGNSRTQTMRAFTAAEMAKILEKVN
jgi:uncharacterized protein with GYD domain